MRNCFRKKKNLEFEEIDVLPIIYYCDFCEFKTKKKKEFKKHTSKCLVKKNSIYDVPIQLDQHVF